MVLECDESAKGNERERLDLGTGGTKVSFEKWYDGRIKTHPSL